MKAFATMLKTELKLSFRGADMFIFAICMPIVIIVILGFIYGDRPAYDGASYTFLAQSFGAVACVSICAGGVMGLPLVVSDYRAKKILKRLRVTPVNPVMILMAQLVVYAVYAVLSLVSVYTVSAICFGYRFTGGLFAFLGSYILVMLSIFSIGILVGGLAKNSKSAGIIASVLYFPMLLLSGTTLPYEVLPRPLQYTAEVMPLTHGIKLLKASSLGLPAEQVSVSILILAGISVLCIGISVKCFRWE